MRGKAVPMPTEAEWSEAIKDGLIQEVTSLRQRNAELEAALEKIVDGPEGKHDHESGCPFERFACRIAYAALQKPE